MSFIRMLVVTAVGVMTFATPMGLGVMDGREFQAQPTVGNHPSFSVATVKTNKTGAIARLHLGFSRRVEGSGQSMSHCGV